MKKITLSALILSALIISCSKSEDSCSFSKETFQGKTYKMSIESVDSNGINITNSFKNRYNNDPCDLIERDRFTLNSDGTYKSFQTPLAGCTTRNDQTGTWSVLTQNGKNLMMTGSSGSSSSSSEEIYKYDCNSFQFIESGPSSGVMIKIVYKFSKI
jgi:uncharacterized lipoprotein NlpE involved in copper resistance